MSKTSAVGAIESNIKKIKKRKFLKYVTQERSCGKSGPMTHLLCGLTKE